MLIAIYHSSSAHLSDDEVTDMISDRCQMLTLHDNHMTACDGHVTITALKYPWIFIKCPWIYNKCPRTYIEYIYPQIIIITSLCTVIIYVHFCTNGAPYKCSYGDNYREQRERELQTALRPFRPVLGLIRAVYSCMLTFMHTFSTHH